MQIFSDSPYGHLFQIETVALVSYISVFFKNGPSTHAVRLELEARAKIRSHGSSDMKLSFGVLAE